MGMGTETVSIYTLSLIVLCTCLLYLTQQIEYILCVYDGSAFFFIFFILASAALHWLENISYNLYSGLSSTGELIKSLS